MYKIGDIATWRGINREYKGEIVGFHEPFAIARIDGTGKSVLLGEAPKKKTK